MSGNVNQLRLNLLVKGLNKPLCMGNITEVLGSGVLLDMPRESVKTLMLSIPDNIHNIILISIKEI